MAVNCGAVKIIFLLMKYMKNGNENSIISVEKKRIVKFFSVLFLLFFFTENMASQCYQSEKDILEIYYNTIEEPDLLNWDFSSSTPLNNSWEGITMTADGCHVRRISIYAGGLSGQIPPEFGNLSQLEKLSITNSFLTGIIPSELGSLGMIDYINLSNNDLTGIIPPEVGNLTQLTDLHLFNNQLSGVIPDEIGNLVLLNKLQVDNNLLIGEIPSEIGNLILLQILGLSSNQFTGDLPIEFNNLNAIWEIEIGNNNFTGSLPAGFGFSETYVVYMQNNQFTGGIPAEWGQFSDLGFLDLSHNQLTGNIPSELTAIGGDGYFSYLNLSNNNLSGELQMDDISNLTGLHHFEISNNQFNGSIPSGFSGIPNIHTILLDHNEFSGSIPYDLGEIQNMYRLFLNSNQLTSCIPPTFHQYCSEGELLLGDNPLMLSDNFEYFCLYDIGDCSVDIDQDVDGDLIPDISDNCPIYSNSDQLDFDLDGLGDLCDDDIDGDGVPNDIDCAPLNASIGLGLPCDDDDPETINDVYLLNCLCFGNVPPANDLCEDAIEVFGNTDVEGTTMFSSSVGSPLETCGASGTGIGVWYMILGTGEYVSFSTCGNTDISEQIVVYSGGCNALTCEGASSDTNENCEWASSGSFLSEFFDEVTDNFVPAFLELGETYYVLITNFGEEQGDFTLSINANEVLTTGCMDPLSCNYDSEVLLDDESCISGGCSDEEADNYDSQALCSLDELCLYSPIYGCGEYSSSPNLIIDDDNDPVDVITISGVTGLVDVMKVIVKIDHTYIGDLDISLTNPSGTIVKLFDNSCAAADNIEVQFDDEGALLECQSPTMGFYIPAESLFSFHNESFEGDWTLTVTDDAFGDEGILIQWCLLPVLSDVVDNDFDGIPNSEDNCIELFNPDQLDNDGDLIGDACDFDIDGDGLFNYLDCFPFDANLFLGSSCDDGNPNTIGDILMEDCSCQGELITISLHIVVFLEGPYSNVDNKMTDFIRTQFTFPLSEPYTSLGEIHDVPSQETTSPAILSVAGNNAIVDWVFIQIRDGENPTEVLETRAALLQVDGDVVSAHDGESPLNFTTDFSSYNSVVVAIKHRAHFGVRTLDPIPLDHINGTNIELDFFDQNLNIFGGEVAMKNIAGIRVMIAGDANRDGAINAVDKNDYWRPGNSMPYDYIISGADFNLDGTINPVDKNDYWRVNNGVSLEQLD